MNIYAVGLALAGFDEQAGTAFVRANIRRSARVFGIWHEASGERRAG